MWENKAIGTKKRQKGLKVKSRSWVARFFLSPAGKAFLVLFALGLVGAAAGFSYYYVQYSTLIDEKLRAGPFVDTSKIYAAPQTVAVGDKMTPAELASIICIGRDYGESSSNRIRLGIICGPMRLKSFPARTPPNPKPA